MKWRTDIIIYSLVGAVLTSAVAVGIAGNNCLKDRQKCTGVSIIVKDSLRNKFISGTDVRKYIDKNFGGCLHRYCSDIDLWKLEKTLEEMGCLKEHEAYLTAEGKLHIVVSQMTPVLKIQDHKELYYVDAEGNSFKVKQDWCSDCLEIHGKSFLTDEKWRRQIALVADFFRNDKEWKKRKISVTSMENGEIKLAIDQMHEQFVLGPPTRIEEKMKKAGIYETVILPQLEEGKKYETVTLKYKGQIVCR